MLDSLINDIGSYIEYLQSKGLYITVHGEISECLHEIPGIDIHNNPFCIMLKSDTCAWEKCVLSQKKIYESGNKEPFWGMCHAGVEEYVFPVYGSAKLGFVCVGGYAVNAEKAMPRIESVAAHYFADKKELLNAYRGLNHQKPDMRDLSVLINPLIQMLKFLYMIRPSESSSAQIGNQIYSIAVRYIERNYMQNITLADIAAHCSCSVSSVSHIFSSCGGCSVGQYITRLRISQAKKMLKCSKLPIKSISALCGFGEPDYFSTAFKKYTGMSPSEYRAR